MNGDRGGGGGEPIDANIDLYACGDSNRERVRERERRSKTLFGIAGTNIYDGTRARPEKRIRREKDVVKSTTGF